MNTTRKKTLVRGAFFLTLILILTLNSGSRTLVRRWFEKKKLNSDIATAYEKNARLKKRIYYLENEPSYIERAVREELLVIAPGEVEYRFNKK
ncbi:FtsB family cell division protein [Endomicrobium proavitum]|uniref:Septum formation initiator n=1 Tax=Endomicrobium proavitum TaxID=1408281 RepID=A0A0G3WIT8_9BACT|nr:septum formation initiator family protein [Endomicrobium proavitum]AKL98561.1 septum formation initiator [Endomicrobium proavitum]